MGMEYEDDIYDALRMSMTSDYARMLAMDVDFYNAVMQNIIETSGFTENGYFNDYDLRLAIGRIILDKFGIPC